MPDNDINQEMKQEAASAAVEPSIVKESPKESDMRLKQSSSALKNSQPGSARRREMVVADEED